MAKKIYKVCTACKIEKEASKDFFHQSKGGLHSHCKDCRSKKRLENMTEERKNKKKTYEKKYYNDVLKYRKNQGRTDEYINRKKKRRKEEKKWLTEEYKKKKREYRKKYKYRSAWRQLLYDTLNRIKRNKESATINELGYSALDLKKDLESKFKPGMNWGNHGEWHIDHIVPVSYFEKGTKANIVSALENLQPLWKKDNLSKGNRFMVN